MGKAFGSSMARAETSQWRPRGIAISRARQAIALLAFALFVATGFAGDALAARSDHKAAGSRDATDSIKLAPIIVPIIGGDRVVGQAGVRVQLVLADPGDFNIVDRARGRLVDAFFRDLYALFDQFQGAPANVSAAIIKQHLTRVADRVLGPGKIRDIVILASYERRNRS
jgi:hypothetical protein